MTEFTAPSGAKVVINVAPWIDAKNLKKAVQRNISFEGDFGFSEKWLMSQICQADSSDEVDAALWPCLMRCTYNLEKITPETFNSKESRADYYAVVIPCIQENLAPLMEGLFSKLFELGILKKRAVNPE